MFTDFPAAVYEGSTDADCSVVQLRKWELPESAGESELQLGRWS